MSEIDDSTIKNVRDFLNEVVAYHENGGPFPERAKTLLAALPRAPDAALRCAERIRENLNNLNAKRPPSWLGDENVADIIREEFARDGGERGRLTQSYSVARVVEGLRDA